MEHRRLLLTATMACGLGTFISGGCDSGSRARPGSVDGGTGGQAGETEPTGHSGGQAGGQGGGQAGGQGGNVVTDDVALLMQTYPSWQPLTDTAVDISVSIFNLCRLPTSTEDAFAKSTHARHALRDWANPQAIAGIAAQGAGGFAEGAAIVKEKFATTAGTQTLKLAALGMMVKRAPGFDSASGDWEFVYWNATDGISRGAGQLASCSSCHAGTRQTDFVFMDESWRTAAPR